VRALLSDDGAPAVFALYVTKGLVDVAEHELTEHVEGGQVLVRDDRFLLVRMTFAQAAGFGVVARTVDDLRLVVAGPSPIGTAADLDTLCRTAASTVESLFPAGEQPWSVTVSALDPPWRAKPRWATTPILAARLHGADPAGTTRSPVDLRLQVEGGAGHLSLNLWDQPIGKRAHEPPPPRWHGSLRPTVAAALVRLALASAQAQATPIDRDAGLYDPFCGSGTIVAEAAHLGLPVFASDRSDEAAALTRARLAGADDLTHRVFVRDVLRGPDQRVTARLIATNLPWGKQVEIPHRTALFEATALLVSHTLRRGGAAVLLTTHEEALAARLTRHGLTVTTRRLGLLGQTPAAVTATPNPR